MIGKRFKQPYKGSVNKHPPPLKKEHITLRSGMFGTTQRNSDIIKI
jgi:hypothetical protein